MFLRVRPMIGLYRSYPRPYWFLLTGMLVNGIGTFVIPFETLYLVTERHLPISQAAAIITLYGVGSFLAALVGGLLADQIGRRPTMVAGLLCLTATTFAFAFARSFLFLAILTFGIGWWISLYRPASSAVVADLIPDSDQARANGLLYWIYNIGMAISPLIASVMVIHGGYVPLFCADGTATLFFCALVYFGVPETRPEAVAVPSFPGQKQPKRTQGGGSILRDLPFLLFTLLMFALSCIYFQCQSTLPADMALHGLSAAQYGVVIAVNGLVVVLLGLPISHALTRWSPLRELSGAALLLGMGFGLTALAGHLVSLPWYAISIFVWTLGEIVFVPASAAVAAALSPIDRRGLYQGVARMSWGLSACAGPLVGGLVLAHWGSFLWIGCATLGIGVAGGFYLVDRRSPQFRVERSGGASSPSEAKATLAAVHVRVPDQEPEDCLVEAGS